MGKETETKTETETKLEGLGLDKDERREAAIGSTPSLQLNHRPIGITSHQLAKFQELHKRRLKIKSKSNISKKSQDKNSKYQHGHPSPKDSADEDESQESLAANAGLKKRRKLHWGLDTKERWERKANM